MTTEQPRQAVWRWRALLALPFVLCGVSLLLTHRVFMVFWGEDETTFHWPMILRIARELPHMNWQYTETATTPLLHLLGACAVTVFGPHLPFVRALNAAFCVGGVWALFGTLHRHRHLSLPLAALLSGVFLSSCYFFGYAFRLLTDDMALVWCILAMAQLFRFADPASPQPRLAPFLWGCLWLGLTIFTRQSYLFLGLPFLVALLPAPLPFSQKVVGLLALALAATPFALLALDWHGLVPPAFQHRHASQLVNLYAPALPLCLLGLYAPFFGIDRLRRFWQERHADFRWLVIPIGAAILGLVIVAVFPLTTWTGQHARAGYIPEMAWEDPPGYFAGLLYTVANHLPAPCGNSLLFWVLLPCGLAAAAVALRPIFSRAVPSSESLASWFLLAIIVSSVLNSICAQKYYDGLVLLFLAWQYPARETPGRPGRIALAGLICAFGVYQGLILARPQGT